MIKNISTIKALAILSVVAAHVDIKVTNSDLFGALQYFYFAFGSLGVGLFFILAGASFSEKVFKASENYQKIKKYAAPWIISGTAIYIYLYITSFLIRKFHIKTIPVAAILLNVLPNELSNPITVTKRYMRMRLNSNPIALTINTRKASFAFLSLYVLLSLNVVILPNIQLAVVENINAITVETK